MVYIPSIATVLDLKQSAGPPADVWSFGMVLWSIASRKLPFSNEAEQKPDTNSVIMRIMNNKLDEIPSDCPKDYGDLITKCRKSQTERPKAQELREKLDQLQENA